MAETEIVFKPRYRGRASFALYLWPISAIGFVFFTVEAIRTGNFYTDGLLALMFALATFSPPFTYFRALCFGETLVVKRYFLPNLVIPYSEIIGFQSFSLRTAEKRISLSNLSPKSFEELEKIVSRFISKGVIKLKKKPERS